MSILFMGKGGRGDGDSEKNERSKLLYYGRGPAEDVTYDIILWYASKIIYLS